jgi:parallel beta-helix repeat protein
MNIMLRTAFLALYSLTIAACGAARAPLGGPISVEAEARAFMAAFESEIRAGDVEAILHRYSRRGVLLTTFGSKNVVPYDELVASYREGWVAPAAFEFDDLSFEVIGADAAAVAGIFRLKWAGDQGFAGTYTSLLVREDGELRIRLEAESMDNLDPSAWCPDDDGCEVPLDSDAQARYVGEYALGTLRYHVFRQDGDLMIEGPFREPRTRLLHLGNHEFRLADVQEVRVVFDGSASRAASLTVFRDVFLGRSRRVDGEARAVGGDTVHVAPPTGERETDRASILAALEQVRPGGTVQFAPGTYLLGGFIPVSVSGVTLLGHRNGTTLRGCDPAERSAPDSRARCNTLALVGSRQVVRNLTFEYMSWGLTVGFVVRGSPEEVFHAGEGGGHRIEGNTFRDSFNGVRAAGYGPEAVVVRGNRFINTYHAGDVFGRRVHFLDNDISAPDPTRLAPFRHVGAATQITPIVPVPGDVGPTAVVDCEENVIAGNRYDGHPDAIVMYIGRDGSCRNNVIRDNTIIVRRARFFDGRFVRIRGETDSTAVGIPLVLADWSEEYSTESRGAIEDNVIEGNRIIGAEGLGIMLHRASRNRVVDNTITGIRRREPFPGNVLWGIDEEQWRHANGSAIWVSPGSDGNEIIGNTFEDVAGYTVVIEGDGNRVELRSPSDSVRDLGTGNRVMQTGHPVAHLEALYRARTDSARARFSAADVRFMTGMIAHHAQALVISRLAPSHGAAPPVRLLAERIVNAQKDEIILMQRWLRDRRQPVPEVDLTGAALIIHGAGHAVHAHGMLTDEEVRNLDAARGQKFDRLFLENMIKHHLGAITMVDELFGAHGAAQDPSVSRLASAIQADQAAEIVRMRRMLAELSLTGRIR